MHIAHDYLIKPKKNMEDYIKQLIKCATIQKSTICEIETVKMVSTPLTEHYNADHDIDSKLHLSNSNSDNNSIYLR